MATSSVLAPHDKIVIPVPKKKNPNSMTTRHDLPLALTVVRQGAWKVLLGNCLITYMLHSLDIPSSCFFRIPYTRYNHHFSATSLHHDGHKACHREHLIPRRRPRPQTYTNPQLPRTPSSPLPPCPASNSLSHLPHRPPLPRRPFHHPLLLP